MTVSPGLTRYLIAVLVLAAASCAPKAPPTGQPPYTGPTLSPPALIARINENNLKIPTLYATAYIEAHIVQKGRTRFVNTEGDLFVRKPDELLLRGRKVLDKVFEIGSTSERYWMSVFLDENKRWWGYHRNAAAVSSEAIPIRPDLLGQVLGISNVNPNLLAPPVPTMTFNSDLRVYMVAWQSPLPDRWFTEKEIWYDLETLAPRKVLLFDRDGRPVLSANLFDPKPVPVPDLPREQWPVMATRYHLYFPETGSTMDMQLSELMLVNERGHPREGTIVWREDPALEEIQIDEPQGR